MSQKLDLQIVNSPLEEKNIDEYLNSPVKKTLSWHITDTFKPNTRAPYILITAGLIVADLFGAGSGLFAAAGLHVWGTYNGLIRRSSVRIRGFTPEGEITEKGALKKIFKKHIVGTVCADLF